MNMYRVSPGEVVNLSDCSPEDTQFFSGTKKDAEKIFDDLNKELESAQELLYAEHKHKILVVLQAMDTGGKDGVIRHVFDGVNPQGVRVANFKVPTPIELDHDYLWRVHREIPGKGEIVIFNRSQYEDVLVVRVHNLVPEKVWSKRYTQINEFERMLTKEGVTILKYFLNISKEEQKKRLLARIEDPTKQWKFRIGDLKERELWENYQKAYEDVLRNTSTEWAPWYIVPSNKKWYRNLVVASILVKQLKKLEMHYPEPEENLDNITIN